MIYLGIYAVTLAVMLAIFYGPTNFYSVLPPTWSTSQLVAYTALSRPGWALGLAVLCILWFSTPADPIARFLSWPVW